MPKKRLSLKKGVWLLLYSPNQNFLGHAVFAMCQVSMRTVQTQNFVKILRAVFEIWTKNIKNAPKMGVFPHLRPPKIFFQKSGSVTFVPLWCTNFMQKIRKILRAVSEIFKDGLRTTDYYYGLRTDMGDYIGPLSGKPGVQNVKILYQN